MVVAENHLGHFSPDGSCQCSYRLERVGRGHGGVPGGHQGDHGFAEHTAYSQQDGGKNAGCCGGQYHKEGCLPFGMDTMREAVRQVTPKKYVGINLKALELA